MQFDLDARTASLGVGDFAEFTLGPRDGGDGAQGLWRAQLGTHWHQELRKQTAGEQPRAEFEVVIAGPVFHRGWTLTLSGRIDQLIRTDTALILREIKTVTRPLPLEERELRADYSSYFAQLAAYIALWQLRPPPLPGSNPPAINSEARKPGAVARKKRKNETIAGNEPLGVPAAPPAAPLGRPLEIPAGDAISRSRDGDQEAAAPFDPSRLAAPASPLPLRAELVFVEAGSGLAQTVVLTADDQAAFQIQLERVTSFLDLRWRARERLRRLRFRPAFAEPRPGQETTRVELDRALREQHGPVFFEAPTGFGKTGMLLECALGQLQSGHFERVLYLTSKSTGQLQVVRTLAAMTQKAGPPAFSSSSEPTGQNLPGTLAPPPPLLPASSNPIGYMMPGKPKPAPVAGDERPLAVWHVRNKGEHCVNHTFHCVREECAFLDGAEGRWPESGLARFYLFENEPRDLESLKAAGRAARICPYEITRAALAFNDVWVGDYNYVFAPRNQGLFSDQPGFDPARTLLVIDEAHNLPSRVADAHSHVAQAEDARGVLAQLDHLEAAAPLLRAWESWTMLLSALVPTEALDPALEADLVATLGQVADALGSMPPDFAALGPQLAGILWETSELVDWLANDRLKKLLWCPRAGELHFTCFDAADAIGETLRAYGGVIFASATLSPVKVFAENCGLAALPTQAGASLGTPVSAPTAELREAGHVVAHTPWRDGAYDVAFDARVDTSFQQRTRHHATTAATIEELHLAATARKLPTPKDKFQTGAEAGIGAVTTGAIAVFFPSYAYADAIQRTLEQRGSVLRVALQPRLKDLAAQTAWVEESLVLADALFLVLGSSFAESIDLLGGRVTHAMVVGPALPEVNAVQRARLAELAGLGREESFRRVYQVPGMTKVNQALGRLVRAPGQRARVILHCRRFLEPSYAGLLAPEYQLGTNLLEEADLARWLGR